MKKLLIIMMMAATYMVMSACIAWGLEPYILDEERLKTNTVSVDLIQYLHPGPEWVRDEPGQPFDFNRMRVIETLPTEQLDEFIISFTEIPYDYFGQYYNAPVGICIKINYDNGDFLIACCNFLGDRVYNFVATYDISGEITSTVGGFPLDPDYDYYALVNSYFDTQLTLPESQTEEKRSGCGIG